MRKEAVSYSGNQSKVNVLFKYKYSYNIIS